MVNHEDNPQIEYDGDKPIVTIDGQKYEVLVNEKG